MDSNEVEIRQRFGQEIAKSLRKEEKRAIGGVMQNLRDARDRANNLRASPVVPNPNQAVARQKPFIKDYMLLPVGNPQRIEANQLKDLIANTLNLIKQVGHQIVAKERLTEPINIPLSNKAKSIILGISESDITEETAPYINHLIDECIKREFLTPQRQIELAEEVRDLLRIDIYLGKKIINKLLEGMDQQNNPTVWVTLSPDYQMRYQNLETETQNRLEQYDSNNIENPLRRNLVRYRLIATDLINAPITDGIKAYNPHQERRANNFVDDMTALIQRASGIPDRLLSQEAKSLIKTINVAEITNETAPYIFHVFERLFTDPDLINNQNGLLGLAEHLRDRGALQLKEPIFGQKIIREILKRVESLGILPPLRPRFNNLNNQIQSSKDALIQEKRKLFERSTSKLARLYQEEIELINLPHFNFNALNDVQRAEYRELRSMLDRGEQMAQSESDRLDELWRAGGANNANTAEFRSKIAERRVAEVEMRSKGVSYEDLFFNGEQAENIRKYIDDFETVRELMRTDQGKAEYRLKIIEIFSNLYLELDRHPTLPSHEVFNTFYLDPTERRLREQMRSVEQIFHGSGDEETARFIEGVIESQIRIKELWIAFHDGLIYAHMGAGFDEWIKLIQKQWATHFAELYVEPREGAMFRAACSVVERYLQGDFALNDNHPRPELLGGAYTEDGLFYSPDDEHMKKIIESTLVGDKECEGAKDWEIRRALSLAKGYHLMATLRMLELFASSDPRKDFRGNFLASVLAQIYLKWSWQYGRGGEYTLLPNYLGVIKRLPVSTKGRSFWQLLKEGGWSPKKTIHLIAQNKEEELGRELVLKLLGGDAFLEDIMHDVCFIGRESRNGWRVVPAIEAFLKSKEWEKRVEAMNLPANVKAQMKDFFKKYNRWDNQQEWQVFFKSFLRPVIGSSAEFWYSESRATIDFRNLVKARFLSDLRFRENVLQFFAVNNLDRGVVERRVRDIEMQRQLTYANLTEAEWEQKRFELFNFNDTNEWKVMEDEDLEFLIRTPAGRDQKISRYDLIDQQKDKYNGIVWNHLLRRSPIDFLLPLCQLVPELLKSESDWHKINQGRKNDLIIKFGGLTDLEAIRSFFRDVGRSYGVNYDADGFKQDQLIRLEQDLNQAFFKLQQGTSDERKNTLDLNLITNPDIRKAVSRLISNFGHQSIELDELTLHENARQNQFIDLSKNFFVNVAKEFVKKGYFFPTSADMDQTVIDTNLAKVGEEMIGRLYGDLNALRQITGAVAGFEEALLNVAQTGKDEHLFPIFQKVMDYRQFISLAAARRINYNLLSITDRLFQTDWIARIPILGRVLEPLLGEESSVIRMWKHDIRFHSKNSDGLRRLHELVRFNGWIAKKGPYSQQKLDAAVGTGLGKIIFAEFGWDILGIVLAYLIWRFISQSLKEAEGKKQ